MVVGIEFDVDGCMNALIQRLIEATNVLMQNFYKEAVMGLSGKGKAASEVEGAELTDHFSDPEADYQPLGQVAEFIQARCKFYADAIMESFGTGSEVDISERSYWREYQNSIFWNEKRLGHFEIVGRPGPYLDIYGNKDRQSSGRAAGRNVEGRLSPEGNIIEPIEPSYSIQNAETWLVAKGKTRVERYIERVVTQFLQEDVRNYLREVKA